MRAGDGLKRVLRASVSVAALAVATLASDVLSAAEQKAVADSSFNAKSPVLLQADELIYDSQKNIVTAKGTVEIASDQRVLLADSVTYDQNTGQVTADGHVSLLEPNGDVAFSDHVLLTDDLRNGALQGFSALLGKTGRLVADTGERREGRYTEAGHAVFTPRIVCAENGDKTPLWQVKAAKVVHDQNDHVLTFSDATFEFAGTPVFYLPEFSTPDPSVKRKSGFLAPDVGSSTLVGSFARVPYYYAINDNEDLTLMPVITTLGGELAEGEYRQRWLTGGMWLQGSIGYDADPKSSANPVWLSHIFGSGRTLLSDNWRAGFDVELTSNDTYLRRYDISLKDRLASDLFVDSVQGRSRVAATGYFFQSLRSTDSTGQIPYVLPLVEYTYIPEHPIMDGRLRVDASFLSLFRNEGEDTTRASVSADWRLPYQFSDGEMLTFQAFGRGDFYHLQDVSLAVPLATQDTRNVSRALGALVAEWRFPFASATAIANATTILEPIVQLVYTPRGGNPTILPNEDATSFEFDETNLFTINKLPGLVRWSDGTRVDAGVRGTALLPIGSVQMALGQEYRVKADPLFPAGSGLGDKNSDLVGSLEVRFDPYIDLVHRFRIDEHDGSIRRNEIYLKGHYGRSSIDLSYLQLSAEAYDPTLGAREEVNVGTTLGVYGDWSVFAGMRRNLETDSMVNTRFGVLYEDECFVASLGYERKYTRVRDLPPSSSILLHIGLKTGFTSMPL